MMRKGLRTAVDVALGAATSGWESVQRRKERYAQRGRTRRAELRERVGREASAWRESGRHQTEWLEERVREEVHKALHRAHLVTRTDYDALEGELQRVRQRLAQVEARVPDESEAGSDEDSR